MIQHDEEAVVSHARARTLADCWRDEQDAEAPLSELADTGAISDATVWALRSDLQRLERAVATSEVEEPMSSRGQLRALLRYVTACGERGPVPGWTGLTDRDIYSDHSVPVRHSPEAAAPAPVRSRGETRGDDRVVPFPAHRARSGDDVVPLASRRLRGAEEAQPARRPRPAEEAPPARRPRTVEEAPPARRPRTVEEAPPARRPRAAEDTVEEAPPARRPRGDAEEFSDAAPLAAQRTRYRDDARRPLRPRDGDDVAPRPRPEAEESGFGPAEVSRPEERARLAREQPYPGDDEVVYSALDGPYDVDWTG